MDQAPTKPMATWRVPSQISDLVEHSPKETLALRLFAWFFVIFGLTYYFMIARRWELGEAALSSHVQVLSMIAIAELSLVFLYTRLANKIDLGPGLRRLQTKVPDENACPIAIEVLQNDVVTGCDEGFFWIEDGTLFFKGLQTVFRLNAVDVPPLSRWPRKLRPSLDKGVPPRMILFNLADRTIKIRIKLIDPFEDRGARRRTALFDRSLTKWLHGRPAGSLESLLPPLELHDALRHSTWYRYEGLAAGAVLLVINLAILATSRLNLSTNDLVSFANALEFGAGLVLSWVALKLILSQWRNLKVRHLLATQLPKPIL